MPKRKKDYSALDSVENGQKTRASYSALTAMVQALEGGSAKVVYDDERHKEGALSGDKERELVQRFASALNWNQNIRCLSFGEAKLSDRLVKAVIDAIPNQINLLYLELESAHISSENLSNIATVLSHNPSLTGLGLPDKLGLNDREAAHGLIKILSNGENLAFLNINHAVLAQSEELQRQAVDHPSLLYTNHSPLPLSEGSGVFSLLRSKCEVARKGVYTLLKGRDEQEKERFLRDPDASKNIGYVQAYVRSKLVEDIGKAPADRVEALQREAGGKLEQLEDALVRVKKSLPAKMPVGDGPHVAALEDRALRDRSPDRDGGMGI